MMRMIREDEEKKGLLDGDDSELWYDHKLDQPTKGPCHPQKTALQSALNRLPNLQGLSCKLFSKAPGLSTASLSTLFSDSAIDDQPAPRRRTAWLDGLRGFAAFIVLLHHHVLWTHSTFAYGEMFESSWGYKGRYYFAAFHGIRTFFSGGHYAVSIFFVISGYVLTSKPLQLIQDGEFSKLAENLASALYRRWLRLHMPLIATTFIFFTSWHVLGIWVNHQLPAPTYLNQIYHYFREYKFFSFVFSNSGSPWLTYNFHSWSIPAEMKGSIAAYTSVLAFAKLTKGWRLGCQVGLMFYFMYIVDAWFIALFIAGMTLADFDLQVMKGEIPRPFARLEKHRNPIFWMMFAIGVFLGGVPSHDQSVATMSKNPAWGILSYLHLDCMFDYKWAYLFWAAVLTVTSIQRLPIKAFFENGFCQYLGKISYSLYLVHGPLLWTVGDRIYTATGWYGDEQQKFIPQWVDRWPLPRIGLMGLEVSFLIPFLLFMMPLTLFIAELATEWIDTPSVKFGQRLYSKACGKPKGEEKLIQ